MFPEFSSNAKDVGGITYDIVNIDININTDNFLYINTHSLINFYNKYGFFSFSYLIFNFKETIYYFFGSRSIFHITIFIIKIFIFFFISFRYTLYFLDAINQFVCIPQ